MIKNITKYIINNIINVNEFKYLMLVVVNNILLNVWKIALAKEDILMNKLSISIV